MKRTRGYFKSMTNISAYGLFGSGLFMGPHPTLEGGTYSARRHRNNHSTTTAGFFGTSSSNQGIHFVTSRSSNDRRKWLRRAESVICTRSENIHDIPYLLELLLEVQFVASIHTTTVPTVAYGFFSCFKSMFYSISNHPFSNAHHLRLSAVISSTLHHARSWASVPPR